MKKIKKRAYSLLALIGATAIFLTIFLFRLAADGEAWATFPSNPNVFHAGELSLGEVLDRNGVVLAQSDGVRMHLSESAAIRRANMHIVGDRRGNIGTGILSSHAGDLIGFNLITGTYSLGGGGNSISLTIDAELNRIAYEALAGRHGAVVVMNYETGEILVSVSAPTYDPDNMPDINLDDPAWNGVFLNRVTTSIFTPGSIFKIVTAAASLDTFSDALTRTYTCRGYTIIDGNRVNCTGNHGTINLEQAFGFSCNPYFALLALDLGGPTMRQYTERFGLLRTYNVDGIQIAAGRFTAGDAGSTMLAWSGVGQAENLINPLSFTRMVGAIPRGGTPVEPRLIESISGRILPYRTRAEVGAQIMPPRVANELASIMRSASINHYSGTFGNLPVAGKTGTAEVGEGRVSHAWFAGFLDDPNHPLAFTVLVEHGGGGLTAAGSVANTVLQAAVR